MKAPDKISLVRKLIFRIVIALTLLAVFSFLSYFVYSSAIKNTETNCHVINLSTQQRFLSERIALLSLSIFTPLNVQTRNSIRKELNTLINNLERGHNYLIHPSGLPERYRSNEIKAIYFNEPINLDKQVHDFIANARLFAAHPPTISEGEAFLQFPQGRDRDGLIRPKYVFSASAKLLYGLVLVIEQYEQENKQHILSLYKNQQLILGATLTLLLLVWLLIFKPIVREIKQNITKHKNIIESTRSELTLITNAIEQTDDIVTITDTDGTIQYVNRSFETKTGYSKEESIGKTPAIIKSGMHDKTFYKMLWKTIIRGNVFTDIVINKKKNGELYYEKKHITPIKTSNNKITGFVSIGKDMTEYMQIQMQLAEQEKKYRTLVEEMNEGFVVYNTDGIITFANSKFCKLLGYSKKEEIINYPIYNFLFNKNTEIFKDKIKQRMSGIKENYQLQFIRKDGEFMHLYISASPYYKDGEITGVIEVVTDITKQKEAEKKLISKNKELQNFFWRITHDIRTPVANILGLAAVFRNNRETDKTKQFIDYFEKSALQMDKILFELMNIGKMFSDDLAISKINFDALLGGIKNNFSNRYDFTGIKFLTGIIVKNDFYCDESILHFILHNLIDNGIRYKNPRAKPSFISVTAEDYKTGVKITIADNGIGMNSEIQNHAYEMFYRGTAASEGIGMGLYLVKTSVEKLGGFIKLQSKEKKGTAFTICIPSQIPKNNETLYAKQILPEMPSAPARIS